MSWIYLIVSGLLECAWAIGLKYSDGFSKLWPSLFTLVTLTISMVLLAMASRELPIGTAYTVWVGIGALGTSVLGIVLLGEPASAPRIFCLAAMVVSIIGLKLTS